MSKPLTVVTAETPAPAPKKKREKIQLIETQPEADWFVPVKTKGGRKVWYLRLKITGRNPRLYGPFKSKHQGLLFLDEAIDELANIENEISDAADKRSIDEPCAKVWPPIIEYPVCG